MLIKLVTSLCSNGSYLHLHLSHLADALIQSDSLHLLRCCLFTCAVGLHTPASLSPILLFHADITWGFVPRTFECLPRED
jgi:hypothetical protein